MARRIFKYQLPTSLGGRLQIPSGATIVHVALQNKVPCLWAIVQDDALVEVRFFMIFGTGHALPTDVEYVGTFQDSPFVWHLFERSV